MDGQSESENIEIIQKQLVNKDEEIKEMMKKLILESNKLYVLQALTDKSITKTHAKLKKSNCDFKIGGKKLFEDLVQQYLQGIYKDSEFLLLQLDDLVKRFYTLEILAYYTYAHLNKKFMTNEINYKKSQIGDAFLALVFAFHKNQIDQFEKLSEQEKQIKENQDINSVYESYFTTYLNRQTANVLKPLFLHLTVSNFQVASLKQNICQFDQDLISNSKNMFLNEYHDVKNKLFEYAYQNFEIKPNIKNYAAQIVGEQIVQIQIDLSIYGDGIINLWIRDQGQKSQLETLAAIEGLEILKIINKSREVMIEINQDDSFDF